MAPVTRRRSMGASLTSNVSSTPSKNKSIPYATPRRVTRSSKAVEVEPEEDDSSGSEEVDGEEGEDGTDEEGEVDDDNEGELDNDENEDSEDDVDEGEAEEEEDEEEAEGEEEEEEENEENNDNEGEEDEEEEEEEDEEEEEEDEEGEEEEEEEGEDEEGEEEEDAELDSDDEMDNLVNQAVGIFNKQRDGPKRPASAAGISQPAQAGLPTDFSLQSGVDRTAYVKFEGEMFRDSLGVVEVKDAAEGAGKNEKMEEVMQKLVAQQRQLHTAPPAHADGSDKKKEEGRATVGESMGRGWFDMEVPVMTQELKRDLQLVRMRNFINPKRFYKSEDHRKLPKFFQMGTVIEGAHEYRTARLTKKERRTTLVDELMADDTFRMYSKRKMSDIHSKKVDGKKKWYKEQNRKRSKKH